MKKYFFFPQNKNPIINCLEFTPGLVGEYLNSSMKIEGGHFRSIAMGFVSLGVKKALKLVVHTR